MSLLTIATTALQEIGGFDIPTSFYGNLNKTAVACVALSNRSGRSLQADVRWSELLKEGSIATVASTATYPKPTDFRAFANMSQWDRTNRWRLTGPIPSLVYQWLQSGISVAASNNRYFMVRGATISIYPTPTTTGDDIRFDYYSNAWVQKQVDSLNATAWTADLDTALLDEDLMIMDLKWRFLQSKGVPYEPEYREFEALKDAAQADSGGRGVIDMGGGAGLRTGVGGGNLPETGVGQ